MHRVRRSARDRWPRFDRRGACRWRGRGAPCPLSVRRSGPAKKVIGYAAREVASAARDGDRRTGGREQAEGAHRAPREDPGVFALAPRPEREGQALAPAPHAREATGHDFVFVPRSHQVRANPKVGRRQLVAREGGHCREHDLFLGYEHAGVGAKARAQVFERAGRQLASEIGSTELTGTAGRTTNSVKCSST